jgi:hypothetical protein
MRLACRFLADGTVRGLTDSIGALIDVTDHSVRATDELARLIAEHHRVLVAINAAILDARV